MSRRSFCIDSDSIVRNASLTMCALLALGCAKGEGDRAEDDSAVQPTSTSSAGATSSGVTPSPVVTPSPAGAPSPTGPASATPSAPSVGPSAAPSPSVPPLPTVEIPVPPASSTVAPMPSMSTGGAGGGVTAGAGGGASEVTGGSGASGSGGAGGAAGGASDSAGEGGTAGATAEPDDMSMSFFVTSSGVGDGGNLGGLDGADAFCTALASAADPALATKTWRAYLSTDTVNARDRIGAGPWRNANLEIIANNVEELHAQEPDEALDATWPPADLSVALDENGEEVVNDVHDILTGTLVDGTVATDLTCDNWTSNSADMSAQVGHSNRDGGGRPPYFNATHEVGCAEGEQNREAGTVTQGGGRGSIYCFASD